MNDSTHSLVAALSSHDEAERLSARARLIEIGSPAVPALVKALQSPSERARWEAAKALAEIRDPGAAPALVDALEDEESAVRWLAAKALISLGRSSLVPVLQGVERCADNLWLRQGTVQVLHALIRDGLAPEAVQVLKALEDLEPRVGAPLAAHHALERIQQAAGGQRGA